MPLATTRTTCRIVIACAALVIVAISAAADDPVYKADFIVYRLSGVPVASVSGKNAPVDEFHKLSAALDTSITADFNRVHLTDVLNKLKTIVPIEFYIDPETVAPPPAPRARTGSKSQSATEQASGGSVYVTDGIVDKTSFKNVPLRRALDLLLKPLKLAFVPEGDRVRICAASVFPVWTVSVVPDSGNRVVFWRGALRIGNAEIPLGPSGDDDIADLLKGVSGVQQLSHPMIVLAADQVARIQMDDQSGAVFLELKPNSAGKEFVLRESDDRTGLALNLSLAEAKQDSAAVHIGIEAKYLEKRETLAGTSLPAGRPIFQTATDEVTFRTEFGNRFAIIKPIGPTDDRLLLLGAITRNSAQPVPLSLRKYTVESKFILVCGEPDWQWWMRPYERQYKIGEGAGRALGPASVAELEDVNKKFFNWSHLGFRKVNESKLVSSPRGTETVDHKQLLRDGVPEDQIRGKPKRPSTAGGSGGALDQDGKPKGAPAVDALYSSITGTPRTFTREELQGILFIADVSYFPDEKSPDPRTKGVLTLTEATSTTTPGAYTLDQTFLMFDSRLGVPGTPAGSAPPMFRAQLKCTREVSDGSAAAFLMPIADDEYLIVLTDFSLVKE